MFYSTGRACLAAQAACPDSLYHSNSQEPDVDPKYEPQQAHPTRQSQREKGGNETEWQHGGQGETQRLPIAPTLPWRGWENQHLPRWMLFLLTICCVVGTPFLSISLATYLEVSYGKDYIITYQPLTVCKQAVCLKSGHEPRYSSIKRASRFANTINLRKSHCMLQLSRTYIYSY